MTGWLAVATGVVVAGLRVGCCVGVRVGVAVTLEVGHGEGASVGVAMTSDVGHGVNVGDGSVPVTPSTSVWVCSPTALTTRRWYSCGSVGQISRPSLESTRSSSR